MPGGLATGQLVDERYALEEPLGEDALGTTWRAHDRGLGRDVHLRDVRYPDDLFAHDPARLRQALMAARLAIRLDHAGAVHVYDAFVDGDRLVIVTEPVAARSLDSLVERKGPLPPKRAAAIGLDLLDPLTAAHAKGLVHGSITPGVVLVPEHDRSLLAGFGLAPAFLDDAGDAWVEAMGTPSCIAPEQVEHRGATPASDLWALGATLYYAVEGSPAFESLDDVVAGQPRPAAKAGRLGPVLERLLSRDPASRPGIEDLRPELMAIAGVAGSPAPPEPPRRRGRRERGRPEPEAPPQTVEAEAETEPDVDHDWNAALTDQPATFPDPPTDETAWTDWSSEAPTDASDVWLPDLDFEDGDAGNGPGEPAESVAGVTDESDERAGAWAAEAAGPDPATGEAAEAAAAHDEWGPGPTPAPAPEVAAALGYDFAAPEPDQTAVDAREPAADEPRRFRSAPSWPPPEGRRSFWIVTLCSIVMVVMVALLVTNGHLGRPSVESTANPSAQDRPVLATDPASVPKDWIAYRHPSVAFSLAYPPRWTLREEGSVITVRDPATGTELRVDYRKPRGPDPEQTWLAQERDFFAKHPSDYKRLQLSPASYLGHVGALWEYTYVEGSLPVHAVDLGFLTKDYGFSMSFKAPASTWESMLPAFHAFLGSVRAPK